MACRLPLTCLQPCPLLTPWQGPQSPLALWVVPTCPHTLLLLLPCYWPGHVLLGIITRLCLSSEASVRRGWPGALGRLTPCAAPPGHPIARCRCRLYCPRVDARRLFITTPRIFSNWGQEKEFRTHMCKMLYLRQANGVIDKEVGFCIWVSLRLRRFWPCLSVLSVCGPGSGSGLCLYRHLVPRRLLGAHPQSSLTGALGNDATGFLGGQGVDALMCQSLMPEHAYTTGSAAAAWPAGAWELSASADASLRVLPVECGATRSSVS